MRYQQIQLGRLAAAGRKLVADGSWHGFESDDRTHYRVIGRRVQRVQMEADEDRALLRLFDAVPPIPTTLLREGFRHHIVLRVRDDTYLMDDILSRVFDGWECLREAAAPFGVEARSPEGNAVTWRVRFDTWSEESIHRTLATALAVLAAAGRCANIAALGRRDAAAILQEEMRLAMENVAQP